VAGEARTRDSEGARSAREASVLDDLDEVVKALQRLHPALLLALFIEQYVAF
jgi:hypothetical protein